MFENWNLKSTYKIPFVSTQANFECEMIEERMWNDWRKMLKFYIWKYSSKF
jgi:hypothetical protein